MDRGTIMDDHTFFEKNVFCGSQGTFLPGELVLSHSLFARIFRAQSNPVNAEPSSDGETMTSHEKHASSRNGSDCSLASAVLVGSLWPVC